MGFGRRIFLKSSFATLAAGGLGPMQAQSTLSREAFTARQVERRKELWGLLGDLPWDHQPAPPRRVKTEKHDGFTLERLVLDLNGLEPVPALLLIPDKIQKPAPGLLFIHWHGGMYDLGKEQLLVGDEIGRAHV